MKRFTLNPVTLKELRQLVRSRVITWGIVAFPILQLIVTGLCLSAETNGRNHAEIMFGSGLGESPFIGASVILGIAVCIGIPLYAAIKTTFETVKERMALEFITTLSPVRIVSGKMTAAFALMLVATTVTLPFFVLAYLMRGITLTTVFVTPLSILGGGLVALSVTLLIACHRQRPVPLRILASLLVYIALPLFVSTLGLTLSSTYATHLRDPLETLRDILFPVLGVTSVVLLSRAAAAAMLAPPQTDATRPLRKTELALLLITAPAMFLSPEVWVTAWAVFAGFAAVRASGALPEVPRGARAHAPVRLVPRALSYLMSTGGAPGLAFSSILGILVLLPAAFFMSTNEFTILSTILAEIVALFVIPSVCVSLVGGGKRAHGIALGASLAWLVFAQFAFMLHELDALPRDVAMIIPGSIWGIGRDTPSHASIASVCAVAALICVTLVAIREFRDYKRP